MEVVVIVWLEVVVLGVESKVGRAGFTWEPIVGLMIGFVDI